MTLIGKILTFLVFFFSLVFLGFAITVNMLNKDPKTKLSWYDLAKTRGQAIDNLQKDLNARDQETTALKGEVGKLEAQVKRERDAAEKRFLAAQLEAEAARKERDDAKARTSQNQVSVVDSTSELEKRTQEVAGLTKQLKEQDAVISEQIAEMTRRTNRAIQAEVAAKSFQDRLLALQANYRDVVQALERERDEQPTTPTDVREAMVRRPPPEDVSGRIKSVTPDGLAEISIGSDQGLLKGHTLEVFRNGNRPQYFGVLKIVEVTPHSAVGRLMTPQYRKQVQPNDQVASRIIPAR